MKMIRLVLLMTVSLVALAIIGDADYQDEIAEQDFYCEQVLAGYWPDYKNIADEVCGASYD